ncbi:MAG: hypothetical protein JNM31_09045 [Flavobacteriales bacterium]|nr:hypothetical protein [Flavobacteriales bacterium]
MRLRAWWNGLDESAQGAIHFVFIGALVILLLRGVIEVAALVAGRDPLLAPFQAGYLLPPTGALVLADEGLLLRTARAVVAAFGTGVLVILLIRPMTNSLYRAFQWGRWCFLGALLWWLTTAWLLPARTFMATPEGWEHQQHLRISGDLWLPFGEQGEVVGDTSLPEVRVVARMDRGGNCSHVDVEAAFGGVHLPVSRTAPPSCDTALAVQRARTALRRSARLVGRP